MTSNAQIHVRNSTRMPELADGAANLIFESPCFERMDKCCDAPECLASYAGEAFVQRLELFLPERFRVLAEEGSYVLNFAAQIVDGFTSPSEFLIPKAVADAGFNLVQTHVWVKTNAPPTAPAKRVKNTFEFLWHFAKSPNYYFDKDSIRQPHLWADRDPRKKLYHELGRDPGNAILPLADQVNRAKAPDDNVIVMSKSQDQKEFDHGGKMRGGIAGRFIKLLCPAGGLVVDGFNGTGQTGVEALALGRNYVGFELHEERAALARRRLGIAGDADAEEAMVGRFLNSKQLAAYIPRTEEAIRMLVKRGQIPHGRTPDGRVVFDRAAIDKWMEDTVTWVAPGSTDTGPSQTPPAPDS